MSGVLLQKGITQKTASTARKSASIGNADSPLFSGKATSALRRPSEDHSSDSTSTSRGKHTLAASLGTTKNGQVAKKRKRPPFYQSEDDMVRSDLVGTRPGKVVANTSSLSTVVNKSQSSTVDKQSNGNSSPSPAASQSRDAVTTVTNSASTAAATNPTLSCTSSSLTIVDLDPPDALSGSSKTLATSKGNNSRLRHMKKRQKSVQSTLNFRRPSIPAEIITIDDSDDDPSPAAAPQNSTPVALVEAAGEAAIIPTGEVRSNTCSTPSIFTQRVNGFILAAKSLPKPALKSHEVDTRIIRSTTGNAPESPLPVTEAPSIEEQPQQEVVDQLSVEDVDNPLAQSSPAPMPSISTSVSSQGPLVSQSEEVESVVEKGLESLNDFSADIIMQDSVTQEIAISVEKEARDNSPSLQLSTADQVTHSGEVQTSLEEGADVRQIENGDKATEPPNISSKAPSREAVDTTPQSHPTVDPVELDRNMPGARGRIVREYMDLEDKYARIFREQGDFLASKSLC